MYHSVDDKTTVQVLEGRVGPGGLLANIQEPLVCYKDAKYKQTQVRKPGGGHSTLV